LLVNDPVFLSFDVVLIIVGRDRVGSINVQPHEGMNSRGKRGGKRGNGDRSGILT